MPLSKKAQATARAKLRKFRELRAKFQQAQAYFEMAETELINFLLHSEVQDADGKIYGIDDNFGSGNSALVGVEVKRYRVYYRTSRRSHVKRLL